MVFIMFLSSRPFCRRWRRASAAGWCCGLLVLLAAGSGWTLLTFTDRRRPTSSASGVGLVAASSTVGCCGHPGPQVLVHLLAMGGAAGGAAGRSIILLCSSSMLASLVFLHSGRRSGGRRCVCVCVGRRAAVTVIGRWTSASWWSVVAMSWWCQLRHHLRRCGVPTVQDRQRHTSTGRRRIGPSDVATAAAPSESDCMAALLGTSPQGRRVIFSCRRGPTAGFRRHDFVTGHLRARSGRIVESWSPGERHASWTVGGQTQW